MAAFEAEQDWNFTKLTFRKILEEALGMNEADDAKRRELEDFQHGTTSDR